MSQTKKHNKLKPINPNTSCKYMILRNIADQIRNLEGHQKFLKKELPEYWEGANPSDETTWAYFNALNVVKDELRDIQKQLRNLRYIQKVVKLFPDDDFSLSFATDYSNSNKRIKNMIEESKPKKPDSRKVN